MMYRRSPSTSSGSSGSASAARRATGGSAPSGGTTAASGRVSLWRLPQKSSVLMTTAGARPEVSASSPT